MHQDIYRMNKQGQSAIKKLFKIYEQDHKLLPLKYREKIKEQGLQQSGCTTEECAAEIGELLGAQFMISGSVGKLGSTFSVDAKMVSVSTGEMTRTKSVSFDGTVGGLLIEMQILAWEMMDLKPPQPLLLQRAGGDGVDKKVTVTAIIIPRIPKKFPCLDVSGDDRPLKARINNTPENK